MTIDIAPIKERLDLWATLPEPISRCIEQRTGDSLTLMRAAIGAGERYEAALGRVAA